MHERKRRISSYKRVYKIVQPRRYYDKNILSISITKLQNNSVIKYNLHSHYLYNRLESIILTVFINTKHSYKYYMIIRVIIINDNNN